MNRLNTLLFLAITLTVCACSQKTDTSYNTEINNFRLKKNEEMKTSASSPIPEDERADFKGLKYYDPNKNYKVYALFTSIDTGGVLKMSTSGERVALFATSGKLTFYLNDKEMSLYAYVSLEYEGEDYFLPFLDETNGFETYGGGRYLDLPIPTTDSVWIDFNLAYNPYCAYNHDYSCVVPPLINTLPVKIEAGEKVYHE